MRTIKRDIAGVFVFSKDNKVLLGYAGVYSGKLVVPGGGVDEGESYEEAARREVLEEVGINLDGVTLEKIAGDNTGSSEKILRESGEKVLVEMTFFDYVAHLDENSEEIVVSQNDDLSGAQFFSPEDLQNKDISHATKSRLIQFGFLSE